MRTLPTTLPSTYDLNPGVTAVPPDVDVGGYDVMIGGHGFRLATDQQFYYSRATEPTTTHRFDTETEPGEQSLSPLPWIKAQSSFHGGAGQLNLEQGFTAFEYQQEKVDHIRFDNCLGVDVWTPGQVKRLPDTLFFNFGFTSSTMVTAAIAGVDYAIIGGQGGLYQAKWASGPDASPTVTAIDLTGATYGGAANCNVTSLATDGVHYYAVLQLTVVGSQPGVLTYIISGSITSVAAPTPIYDVAGVGTASPRTNLCSNPNFESSTTGWVPRVTGSGFPVTVAQSAVQVHSGANSMLVSSAGNSAFKEGPVFTFATVNGTTYTASAWVWVSPGTPAALIFQVGGTSGSGTTGTGTWQRLSVTFTASASTSQVCVGVTTTAAGQSFYVDDALFEVGAVVGTYFDGSTATDGSYTYSWTGAANASTSSANPIAVGGQALGVVGWVKARLIGCTGGKLYELDSNAAAHTALPSPRYTHPATNWLWTAISESPVGVLAAGNVGGLCSILEFTLDTSGGTPFLSGGASIAQLPVGESVNSMEAVLSTWLAVGTNKGIRIGDYDTYTGRLKLGPLSVNTTQSVADVAARDRFVYGGYTNQQADGKTGLVRLDLSLPTDVAGRLAYAPDLRPPTTAPTGLGAVTSVAVMPASGRMLFLTPEGFHVEGNGPGTDGTAWIRTSRIRYDTAEMKLFKLGRIHGALDVANIQVTGIAPFGVVSNLGTFGFVSNGDPGEFRLPSGLNEWIQLQFTLQGAACVLNSYQTKAYPAPARQHVYTITVNNFRNETDRFGLDVTDPEDPRKRLQNVVDLEQKGDEIRYVEFTNQGSIAQLVVIDQMEFKSFSRPNIEDDFGGYITVRLRTTES